MRNIATTMVLVLFLAINATAAEKKKQHPIPTDPVLGDRLAVTEWAWSPQYAARFGLPEQKDGLKNGPLWLIGISIERVQSKYLQLYVCQIKGLIDNKSAILTPPGDMYVMHPYNYSVGGFPGETHGADSRFVVIESGIKTFTPLQDAWRKGEGNRSKRPASNITINYELFHRYAFNDLAFFELDGSCSHFKDPAQFRNELRFPAGEKKANADVTVKYPIAFDIPDGLMQRIFPYVEKVRGWNEKNLK